MIGYDHLRGLYTVLTAVDKDSYRVTMLYTYVVRTVVYSSFCK